MTGPADRDVNRPAMSGVSSSVPPQEDVLTPASGGLYHGPGRGGEGTVMGAMVPCGQWRERVARAAVAGAMTGIFAAAVAVAGTGALITLAGRYAWRGTIAYWKGVGPGGRLLTVVGGGWAGLIAAAGAGAMPADPAAVTLAGLLWTALAGTGVAWARGRRREKGQQAIREGRVRVVSRDGTSQEVASARAEMSRNRERIDALEAEVAELRAGNALTHARWEGLATALAGGQCQLPLAPPAPAAEDAPTLTFLDSQRVLRRLSGDQSALGTTPAS